MAISSKEGTMDASRSKILGGALAVVLLLLLHVTPTAGASPLALAPPPNPPVLETVIAGIGDHIDATTGLAVGPDGSLYTCGCLWHDATGYDVTVTRLAGAQAGWSTTWNGPGDSSDYATDVALAPDGSVYVLGYFTYERQLDALPRSVLLKFSPDGELQWEARPWFTFGLPSRLGVDAAGNVYACGRRDNEESGGTLVTLERYAPDGTNDWSISYMAPGYKPEMWPADLYVTPGGVTYVAGVAGNVGLGPAELPERVGSRAFVGSWRADGTVRWTKQYEGKGRANAAFSALTPCPSGGIYAVGHTGVLSGSGAGQDLLVTRYRPDGSRALTRRLGAGDGRRQWAADVATDDHGRIAVCGGWRRAGKGYFVGLLRPDGAVVWSHNYPGDARTGFAQLVAVDGDGRVVVAGNAPGSLAGDVFAPGPVQVYAFTTTGEPRWTSTWPTPSTTGTADHTLQLYDMGLWRDTAAWVCGTSDDRPGTGPDQLVLGWTLETAAPAP
jgi:hypothetical protein